jgi:uncharacterized membrane protein
MAGQQFPVGRVDTVGCHPLVITTMRLAHVSAGALGRSPGSTGPGTPPVVVRPPCTKGATTLSIGLLGILPLHATFGTVRLVHRHMSWLVPIGGLAVLAAAIAYVAGIHAARRLGPKLSSFLGLTEVLFAVLFAWFLLGQLPSVVQAIGAVLVITGIVLVRLDESAQVPEQPIDRTQSHGTAPELAVEPA